MIVLLLASMTHYRNYKVYLFFIFYKLDFFLTFLQYNFLILSYFLIRCYFFNTRNGKMSENPMKKVCRAKLSICLKFVWFYIFAMKRKGRKKLDAVDMNWFMVIEWRLRFFDRLKRNQDFLGNLSNKKIVNFAMRMLRLSMMKLYRLFLTKDEETPNYFYIEGSFSYSGSIKLASESISKIGVLILS